MPTIAFKSRIRSISDNCSLDLVVSHRLLAGEPSAAPRVVRHPPPQGVVILSVSPLTITTTGSLNNRKISSEHLVSSRIAQHLPEYLKLNSNELGFQVVSDPHIAEDDLLTFFCTASRPTCPLEVQLPRLKLLGFDVDYSWHETPSLTSPDKLDSGLTPFSSRLTLPYVTTLDDAVERFVRFQMVKRYPRIFGSWIQQLDMEKPFISSIFSSLSNVFRRSSNLAFRESYRMRLKMLEKAMSASLADTENKLSGYLETPGSPNRNPLPEDDETIFIHAMEQTYCFAMKKRKFKVIPLPADLQVLTHQQSISTSPNWLRAADDIFCDQQPLFVGFEEEPHSGASDEEDLNRCWNEYADDSLTSASLSEDVFASDFDPLDMQIGIDQFLRTDISCDVERHDSLHPDFPYFLGSLPGDPGLDYNASQSLENVAAKLSQWNSSSTPHFLSDLVSSVPTSSCTDRYRRNLFSERSANNALPDSSHGFSLSQDISGFKSEGCDADLPSLVSGHSCHDIHLNDCHQEGVDISLPLSAQFSLADTVGECSINGDVDFVAMEF